MCIFKSFAQENAKILKYGNNSYVNKKEVENKIKWLKRRMGV